MSKKKKSIESVPQESSYIKYLAGIMKEIGLTGFIVVVVVAVFLIWGTSDQKREFIDRFILLKHIDQNPFSCVLVVVGLLFLLLVGSIYSSKMSKLRREENNRIGKEKSDLQELLLKKELNSSE